VIVSWQQGPEHFSEVSVWPKQTFEFPLFSSREPNDPIVKWKREFSRSHFVTVSIADVLIMLMTVIRQRPQELHQIALF